MSGGSTTGILMPALGVERFDRRMDIPESTVRYHAIYGYREIPYSAFSDCAAALTRLRPCASFFVGRANIVTPGAQLHVLSSCCQVMPKNTSDVSVGANSAVLRGLLIRSSDASSVRLVPARSLRTRHADASDRLFGVTRPRVSAERSGQDRRAGAGKALVCLGFLRRL
jgi:hypothetical protein